MGQALRAENRTVTSLEIAYLTERRKKTYIACEGIDFIWCESEVREFINMWEKGFPVTEIIEYFDRNPNDITALILDLSMLGKIHPREKGLMG